MLLRALALLGKNNTMHSAVFHSCAYLQMAIYFIKSLLNIMYKNNSITIYFMTCFRFSKISVIVIIFLFYMACFSTAEDSSLYENQPALDRPRVMKQAENGSDNQVLSGPSRSYGTKKKGRYQLSPIVGKSAVLRKTKDELQTDEEQKDNFRLGILKEIKKYARIVKEFGCDENGNLKHIELNGGQTIYFDRFDANGIPLDFRRTFTDGTELVYINGKFDRSKSAFRSEETRTLFESGKVDENYLTVKELFKDEVSSQDIVLFDMKNLKPSFLDVCTYSGSVVLPFSRLKDTKENDPARSIGILNALKYLSFNNISVTSAKDIPLYKVIEGVQFNEITANLHRMYSVGGMNRTESHPWLSWCLYGDNLSDAGYEVYRELEKKCDFIYQQALQKKGIIRYNDTLTDIPIKVWLDKEAGHYELVEKINIPSGEKTILMREDDSFIGIFSIGKLQFTKEQLLDLFKRDLITIDQVK